MEGLRPLAPQQPAITTVDERPGVFDQAEEVAVLRRYFPVARRHVGDLRIEENRADLAIAGAGTAAEDGPQHEGEPPALTCGQIEPARSRPGRVAPQQAMESFDALETEAEIVVERDQDAEPRSRRRVCQPKAMIAGRISDDGVATVFAPAARDDRVEFREVERSGVRESRRRSDDDDRIRNQLGLPEGGRLSGRQFRIADER